MKREDLKIGQKVIVTPEWINKDLPKPIEKELYVRELHNPLVAGLSYKPTGRKHIYGILYSAIHPCV